MIISDEYSFLKLSDEFMGGSATYSTWEVKHILSAALQKNFSRWNVQDFSRKPAFRVVILNIFEQYVGETSRMWLILQNPLSCPFQHHEGHQASTCWSGYLALWRSTRKVGERQVECTLQGLKGDAYQTLVNTSNEKIWSELNSGIAEGAEHIPSVVSGSSGQWFPLSVGPRMDVVAAGYKNTLGRRHFVGENFSVTSPKFQMSNWASVGLHTNTRYDVYIYTHGYHIYIYILERRVTSFIFLPQKPQSMPNRLFVLIQAVALLEKSSVESGFKWRTSTRREKGTWSP